jgi:hypothetical protein
MTVGEIVTDTGATAALTSPLWLPSLHSVSEFAALILPILGAVWLVLQICGRLLALSKKLSLTDKE